MKRREIHFRPSGRFENADCAADERLRLREAGLLRKVARKRAQRISGLDVGGTERLFAPDHQPPVERLRIAVPGLRLKHGRHPAGGNQRVGMLGAQRPLAGREDGPEIGFCRRELRLSLLRVGKVDQRAQGVGVVGAEHACADGVSREIRLLSLRELALILEGKPEVVESDARVLTVRIQRLVDGQRLAVQPLGLRVAPGPQLRVAGLDDLAGVGLRERGGGSEGTSGQQTENQDGAHAGDYAPAGLPAQRAIADISRQRLVF